MRLQLFQPGQLQGRVVIVVEVVHADHFIAPRQQQFGDMHADKTGGSCNQYFHNLPAGFSEG